MRTVLAALLTTALVAPGLAATETPYGGQQTRDIASLSDADVEALLAGRGWGLALPAELNGYPGPAHVLELADELDLSGEQRAEVQAAFDAMRAEARALGADYVAAEEYLSRMFRLGHANTAMLEAQLAASAEALAKLRAVHLNAHLRVTPLLSDDQKAAYARSRGYGGGAHDGHSGHAGHGSN